MKRIIGSGKLRQMVQSRYCAQTSSTPIASTTEASTVSYITQYLPYIGAGTLCLAGMGGGYMYLYPQSGAKPVA